MPQPRPSQFASRSCNRRAFVRHAAVAAVGTSLAGCDSHRPPPPRDTAAPAPTPPTPSAPAAGLTRDAALSLADGKADYYLRLSHNCAQSTFLALHETFGVGEASLAKALTPLPGIAERGETCGAVVSALLAIGFVYGRERLDDWTAWRDCLVPARSFCEQFEAELGSTRCGDIVEKLFGQRYNLGDPVDLGKFQEAGATAKCGRVVSTAVRLAAGLLWERTPPAA